MKFKVWNSSENKFETKEYYIARDGTLMVEFYDRINEAEPCCIPVFSTGQTDKNKVELFEDDIAVNSHGSKVYVYLDKKSNTWMFCNPSEKTHDQLSNDSHTLQKIGNKLENPELLES